MRQAIMLATELIIAACFWAETECRCRVLPEWGDEIRRLWQLGCGHDPVDAITRPAPDGDVLCMAYQSFPDPEHPFELLVAYDSLYRVHGQQYASERLAKAIRACVEGVTETSDFAAVLACTDGERVHLYAARHTVHPLAPMFLKKIVGGRVIVATADWNALAG